MVEGACGTTGCQPFSTNLCSPDWKPSSLHEPNWCNQTCQQVPTCTALPHPALRTLPTPPCPALLRPALPYPALPCPTPPCPAPPRPAHQVL